ncbi:MAG: sulfotransferase family 2 domain-containing protein [Spirochaetota bacterium]|nr:sulfotransferase family 2 domain-containing protein [Spirochaetota bacterium]
MLQYDKDQALISIHIPKCGGQSFIETLKTWYGEKLYLHYYNREEQKMPRQYPLKPGICIHGHFNQKRQFGVEDYYPETKQFITFLRDPFEIKVSNYFYGKKIAYQPLAKSGVFEKIEEYFEASMNSYMLNFFPKKVTLENYQEIIDNNFVFIGILEDYQESLMRLGKKLGFPTAELDQKNKTDRDPEIPDGLREKFMEENPLDFAVYDYACQLNSKLI